MATAAAGDGGTQGIDQSVVESNHQQQQPTLLIPSVLELEAKNRQLKELLTDAQVELERYKNLTENGQLDLTYIQQNYSNYKLPTEILTTIIFNQCDLKSLLNFRLVCKNWKSSIEHPRLMRKLEFTVHNWQTFNNSTIIDKVKSIRIYKPALQDFKNFFPFSTKICHTIEKIKFDFLLPNNPLLQDSFIVQCAFITSTLLKSCYGLKKVQILNPRVLENLALDYFDVAAENLDTLVLITTGIVLQKFLRYFHNLVKIQITNAYFEVSTVKFYSVLFDYIARNENGLLKLIILNGPEWDRVSHEWLKLLFACYHRGIRLISTKMNHIDIQSLLSYKEIPASAPVNENTCQVFTKATMKILLSNVPIDPKRIEYCTNIRTLKIVFGRIAEIDELVFLRKLRQKLESLSLVEKWEDDNEETEDFEVAFPEQAFEYEFPVMKAIKIHGDLFGEMAEPFLSFYIYFPVLKALSLISVEYLPINIFVSLSKIESLQEINLDNCYLADVMFTQHCESLRIRRQEEGLGMELVPAIDAFRELKSLCITDCVVEDISDICIVNGITLSQTLIKVRIKIPGVNILTERALDAFTNAQFAKCNSCFDSKQCFVRQREGRPASCCLYSNEMEI